MFVELGVARVFDIFYRRNQPVHIDLSTVRETLLYIESDLTRTPKLDRLAFAIRQALKEIERLEGSSGDVEKPPVRTARFVPARG